MGGRDILNAAAVVLALLHLLARVASAPNWLTTVLAIHSVQAVITYSFSCSWLSSVLSIFGISDKRTQSR
jgi:multisubunit Na+/H+ antiporter MnhF subunit